MVCSFKREKKGIAITNAFQEFLDVSVKPENIVSQHVSRTSLSKVNKTPPPLKILFGHPRNVPVQRPGDVLK